MRASHYLAVATTMLLIGGAAPAVAGSFTYTVLSPPYPNPVVTGVDSNNQIVGFYHGAQSVDGFSWSNGQFSSLLKGYFNGPINVKGAAACFKCSGSDAVVDTYNINSAIFSKYRVLGLPQGYRPVITGINMSGTVAGFAYNARAKSSSVTQPFSATKKEATLLSPPFDGGGNSAHYNNLGLLINDSGLIAGVGYGSYKGVSGNWLFTYANGTYTISKPPQLADNYVVVSVLADDGTIGGTGVRPFTFKNSTYTLYGPATCTYGSVAGIGPGDEVAGEDCHTENGALQAFIAVNGTARPYEYPGAATGSTTIISMASNGTIVGGSSVGNGAPFLFIGICPANQAPCTQ